MLDTQTDSPPAALIAALCDAGWADPQTEWTRLNGGRTNRLWRFRRHRQTYVCKLFRSEAETPLFANNPAAEAMVLENLKGTGLAPELCHRLTCGVGDALIYRYIAPSDGRDLTCIAQTLARLHSLPPPKGLTVIGASPIEMLAQGNRMLQRTNCMHSQTLATCRPPCILTAPSPQAFLHGDAVPANIIATPSGICLIDWQCPAIGDPVHDLAIFLSPAMQHIYGGQPLDNHQAERFFAAYGDRETIARYHDLAPILHWRMAAYCLWKVASGAADYQIGFDLELASLKEFG